MNSSKMEAHSSFYHHHQDQTNFCFFCLRNAQSEGLHSQLQTEETSKQLSSLRSIFRFLDLEGFHLKFLRDLPSKSAETRFRVCTQCSKVTDQFTELYRILEETNLRINDCLQKISGIMKKAKDSSGIVEQQSHRGKNGDGGSLKLMREMTMGRCMKRIKSASTSKSSEVTVTPAPPAPPPPPTPTSTSSVSPYFQPFVPPVVVPLPPPPPPIVVVPPPPPAPSPLHDTSYQNTLEPKLKRLKKPEHVLCPYCGTIVSNNNTNDKLDKHFLVFHCEHYFPKLNVTFSSAQWKDIAKNYLFQEHLKDNRSCYICGWTCGITRTYARVLYLKLHLVKNHNEVLSQTLVNFHRSYGGDGRWKSGIEDASSFVDVVMDNSQEGNANNGAYGSMYFAHVPPIAPPMEEPRKGGKIEGATRNRP